VTTDFGQLDAVEDLAVQRDGKLVAVGSTVDRTTFAGEFAVARYRRAGALDASFGNGGKVTTGFGGTFSFAYAVALQGDGKIVVAGFTGGGPTGLDIALARYNADGTLDPSFGSGGKVVTDFDMTHDWAYGLAIQPDGKLVAAGATRLFGSYDAHPPDFAMARYNPDGSLDTSFGGGGKISTAFTPGWADVGYDLAFARDGKIVAAGWGLPDGVGGPGVIDLARYNADGSLDSTFDGDGEVVSAPNNDAGAFAVVVQPDDRVVVAGFLGVYSGLVRYTVGGSIDSTFGSNGVASVGRPFFGMRDLVRQPDGKFVAAGSVGASSTDPNSIAFALARFQSSGRPDQSFHGGTVSTDFGALDEAAAVALAPGGKIVAGGYTAHADSQWTITAQDFALARYAGAPTCKVPNVRGRKLALARSAIERAHCRVGKVTRRASQSMRRGRVISQRPKPGATLPNSGKVDLFVSRGRK
jgi:uncharacterized delta-60 repeat protein